MRARHPAQHMHVPVYNFNMRCPFIAGAFHFFFFHSLSFITARFRSNPLGYFPFLHKRSIAPKLHPLTFHPYRLGGFNVLEILELNLEHFLKVFEQVRFSWLLSSPHFGVAEFFLIEAPGGFSCRLPDSDPFIGWLRSVSLPAQPIRTFGVPIFQTADNLYYAAQPRTATPAHNQHGLVFLCIFGFQ